MGLRGEPGHIFHQAVDGFVHLRVAEHIHAAEHVGKGHLLGRSHYDSAAHRHVSYQGDMDVSRSRRHIDEQEIQRAPSRLEDNLLEGGGGHGAAPDEGLSGSGDVAHGEPFHSVLLHGDEEVVVLVLSFHLNGNAFGGRHRGDGGAVDICIGHAHPIPQTGQGHGQVHRNGALAHSALAGSDSNDMAHFPQLLQIELDTFGGRFGRVFHHGIHLNLRSARGVPVQAGLYGAHQVVLKGIRTLGEGQRHVHLVLLYFNFLHQSQVYHALVFLGGMLHLLQPVQYFVLIHYPVYIHCR